MVISASKRPPLEHSNFYWAGSRCCFRRIIHREFIAISYRRLNRFKDTSVERRRGQKAISADKPLEWSSTILDSLSRELQAGKLNPGTLSSRMILNWRSDWQIADELAKLHKAFRPWHNCQIYMRVKKFKLKIRHQSKIDWKPFKSSDTVRNSWTILD